MQKLRDISWLKLGAESAAIVVSILLAFAIDAWWDRYEEARQERIIIEALIRDFEETDSRIGNALENIRDFNSRCDKYIAAIDGGDELPTKDLQEFARGSFQGFTFRASLSAYESSVATGAIEFLENETLRRALSDFHENYQAYLEIEKVGEEAFLAGPLWDVQRELDISVRDLLWPFDEQPHYRMKEAEIRESLSAPILYIWVVNKRILNQNMVNDLSAMKAAISSILIELDSIRQLY